MKHINRESDKWKEMCEHIRAAIETAETAGVEFGGCGCCGGAWATCYTCPERQTDRGHSFRVAVDEIQGVYND